MGTRDPLEQAAEHSSLVSNIFASVVHEMNNPLSAVLSNLSMATEVVAELEPAASQAANLQELGEMLADCKIALDSMDRLIRDMRSFARFGQPASDPQTIGPLCEGVARVLRHSLGRKGRFVLQTTSTARVRISASVWTHVLSSLIVDLLQGVKDSGQVRDTEIAFRVVDESSEVVVTCTATGRSVDTSTALRDDAEGWVVPFSRHWIQAVSGTLEIVKANESIGFRITLPAA